ncbi:MAG TPA: RNB domain-containing ribonuclease [Terriglobales bacterium]|jgi:VacB/RNase II family 3'-5' exoribonuclease|nr:RNB domain-containing ribonuclease [Terriglobales bacterium]
MNDSRTPSVDLQAMARQVMLAEGFEPNFPPATQQQLADIRAHPPQLTPSDTVRDLRRLLWSSIDNDTSKDLDQIEVAERLPNGDVKVMVGIADVDAFVAKDTPIDQHAAREATTVYTGVTIFPMLPSELSTGASSLLPDVDRPAVVTEFVVSAAGSLSSSNVYRAIVRNQAQLTYNAVGAWLEGTGAAPSKVAASLDLQAQLKLQDQVAQALRKLRYANGALNIDTAEVVPLLLNQQVTGVATVVKNRATDLIEDFMIAANGVVARLLEKVSSLRRIVKTPEHWDGIVRLAALQGEKLPAQPDSKALNDFLLKRKAADPDHFADLSLAVIKLIGPGEYILERPGDPAQGHFGLAVQDYTHSTAPNRRFADIVTQRLVKSLLDGKPGPYSDNDLTGIAANCTQKGDAARKVEREMSKRLAAVAMSHRVGETFDAIVTGVMPKGTFVRVMQPHIEGLLAQGEQGLHVGDRIRVKLTRTDVQRGFIDFVRV